MAAWSFYQQWIGSGYKVYICVLGSLSEGAWDKSPYEYNLSPADRWAVIEDYSEFRGYAMGLCCIVGMK